MRVPIVSWLCLMALVHSGGITAAEPPGPQLETGTVTDVDGNVYRTVKIGDQWWMAENLRVKHDPGGNPITWYRYDDSLSRERTYGLLYGWNDAMNGETGEGAQGIAPAGWHIPSDADWQELFDHLGGIAVAGGAMKERGTGHWRSPNTGATDSSGFNGLPGGCRTSAGYEGIGYGGHWWSSTSKSSLATLPTLHCESAEVLIFEIAKSFAHSIRCVKDD